MGMKFLRIVLSCCKRSTAYTRHVQTRPNQAVELSTENTTGGSDSGSSPLEDELVKNVSRVISTVMKNAEVFRQEDYQYILLKQNVPFRVIHEFLWQPAVGMPVTVNVDASYNHSTKSGGVGRVVRDGNGFVRFWDTAVFRNTTLAYIEKKASEAALNLSKAWPGNVAVRGDNKAYFPSDEYQERGTNRVADFLAQYALLKGATNSKDNILQMPKGMRSLCEEDRKGYRSWRTFIDSSRDAKASVWCFEFVESDYADLECLKSLISDAATAICSDGPGKKVLTLHIVSDGCKVMELTVNIYLRNKDASKRPADWKVFQKINLFMEKVSSLPNKYSIVLSFKLMKPCSQHTLYTDKVTEYFFPPESIAATIDLGEFCVDDNIFNSQLRVWLPAVPQAPMAEDAVPLRGPFSDVVTGEFEWKEFQDQDHTYMSEPIHCVKNRTD